MPDWRRSPLTAALTWLTVFALTVVGVVTVIGNKVRAAGNDAVFTQGLVDRAQRFGGTYYANGISPKGPLEDVAHDIARRLGGYDGHFYVISFMVAISAVLIGVAAARTALTTGGNRSVALAAGAVVFVHFTLSDAAYAGLLYSRNILVTLLAVAWFLTLDDRAWSTSPRSQWCVALATGALLGLAVQTILPSFIDASAIGIAALVLVAPRVADRTRRTKVRATIVISAAAAFASAPVWYLLRGRFPEFWASWWTYARYQNLGMGLSISQQLRRGGNNAYRYYLHRPVLFLMLLGFVIFTIAWWPKLDRKTRVVHVALVAWLLGGWFQLVSGVRYSPHYFSVIAAPSAMIGAALAGHAFAAVSRVHRLSRTAVAWPLIAVLLTLYVSAGTATVLTDESAITSNFTSVLRDTQRARTLQRASDQPAQALLDLVSRDGDALLTYSDDQFLYPRYRRVPATRFQQRYFIVGSIYLGNTSSKFILGDTWKWFRSDLRHTNPTAFLETRTVDSKPFSDYVDSRFVTAYDGLAGTVKLRRDVASAVLRGPATGRWRPPGNATSGPGWNRTGSSFEFTQGAANRFDDRLILTTQGCRRINGTLTSDLGTTPRVVFHLEDATGRRPEMRIAIEGSRVTASDANGDDVESISTGGTGTGPLPFSLVLGRDAAALVVNGKVVSAVSIPERTKVTVEAAQPQLSLNDLRVGPAPRVSGC